MPDILPIDFEQKTPWGDNRVRRVCRHCNFIDYQNPKIVAGAVIDIGGEVLLCKRSIAPRQNYWTLPAGFMELGETVEDAAKREAKEEACIDVDLGPILSIYSVPHLGQVHILFKATAQPNFAAGPESQAVALFAWNEIPWRHLAFPTIIWALTDFARARGSTEHAPFTNPHGSELLTHFAC